MDSAAQQLLAIVRHTLWHDTPALATEDTDWNALFALADRQHIGALAANGIGDMTPPPEARLKAKGYRLLSENLYRHHEHSIADIAAALRREGIGMMLLKGIGLSLLWPVPNHRAVGDIDIFTFRINDKGLVCCQSEADDIISKSFGIVADNSHEHHSILQINGIVVENHYDFINAVDLRSSRDIERYLKQLVSHDMKTATICGERIFLPPPVFNAVYLIRHIGRHFSGSRINLRQVLDWAFFVRAFHNDIDWNSTAGYWQKIGLLPFAQCINSICIAHLGFPPDIFHGIVSTDRHLTERIVDDIMQPEFTTTPPDGHIASAFFRLRRFLANGWKRQITYKESSPRAFFSLAISHLRRGDI